jgi:23S rRNA pseudouridine1911/1915/1917 synthase
VLKLEVAFACDGKAAILASSFRIAFWPMAVVVGGLREALDVVYQSPALLVVNKPGGVLTQAPPGIDSMEVRVRHLLGRETYVGVLHRLDRPVSGLLAFGLSRRSTRRIAQQFEDRSISKTYWAVVPELGLEPAGRWVDTMRKVPDEPRSELVPPDHPDAQEARLAYTVLDSAGGHRLLEIRLETGRTHQIRLQAAARQMPVLGDVLYGSPEAFGPPTADERERCIALHARSLALVDPATTQTVSLTAALPAYWNGFESMTRGPVDRQAACRPANP